MTHIIGQHDCKADSKGRVLLPISLKNQLLPVIKEGFVIKRSVFQQCLELYPKQEFDVLMQKVMKKSKINRKYDAFVRNFVAGMKEVAIDGDTGRLQIPKNLVDYAKIDKEVVLNAVFDKIEIWNKDMYEQVLAEGEKDYADLAEEIFDDDE
ncbi:MULTISPECIES: division/cell wall cluster transcriptional repressor MraZ [Flagellimonas]|uniref:Transcriptional regulator MraZ n=2 Tax=Flagellimonas TaxID=444459 RepID=A0A3A1NDS9_9FLAO|nr:MULTISPECIES: division/cell wall cluster transcriptional repressor MraZ [Allomuricauda]RIV42841.1 division/cell wall cluster transcriptional repressor MraZ [Allomuricauda maritima]RIV73957.1 division/cell wall cluster transcriptional repressor MraZ [Allomuricauda aequoris]TXJ92033.1 division/cell wall cluster transcriptional repressor MraZ [Allomuricauda maritima]TXK07647.1 division/cell wall cluster transcriptional repressor MraZ [Allomuricauda aequoris]